LKILFFKFHSVIVFTMPEIMLLSFTQQNVQVFSSPCQRQCEFLPSLGVRHLSSVVRCLFRRFHILIFSSETAQPNEVKLGRQHLCKVLSKDWLFCSNPSTNMATIRNSCFWLADFKKSSLKPLGQMNRNFVGSISGRSSIKIAHFVPIR
jgi:hypothetical protein